MRRSSARSSFRSAPLHLCEQRARGQVEDARGQVAGKHGESLVSQGHLRVSGKTPSEEQALNAQVRELQRMLGTRLQEAETLRDAVELARGPAAWPGASITHAP